MKEIAIACKGIKKSYGSGDNMIEALKGIDLEIYQGELTLLVGPSGSGKTSLLSIITSILTPDSGKLFLLGQDIQQLNEDERSTFYRNNVGIVFQSLFLIPSLTVVENVSLPLLVEGVDARIATMKALDMLRMMRLDHRANDSSSKLSKGQQQRVAIARAIINSAKIIVCDEPTSALDHVRGGEIMDILHKLSKDISKAVLVVTHDHRIFPYADRIITLSDGQIVPNEAK